MFVQIETIQIITTMIQLLLITWFLISHLLYIVDVLRNKQPELLLPPALFCRVLRRYTVDLVAFLRRYTIDVVVFRRSKGILRPNPRYTRRIPVLQGAQLSRAWLDFEIAQDLLIPRHEAVEVETVADEVVPNAEKHEEELLVETLPYCDKKQDEFLICEEYEEPGVEALNPSFARCSCKTIFILMNLAVLRFAAMVVTFIQENEEVASAAQNYAIDGVMLFISVGLVACCVTLLLKIISSPRMLLLVRHCTLRNLEMSSPEFDKKQEQFIICEEYEEPGVEALNPSFARFSCKTIFMLMNLVVLFFAGIFFAVMIVTFLFENEEVASAARNAIDGVILFISVGLVACCVTLLLKLISSPKTLLLVRQYTLRIQELRAAKRESLIRDDGPRRLVLWGTEAEKEEEDQGDPEEADTYSIRVLQGNNLETSLLKIDMEKTKEPCEDKVDTFSVRDDEDETGGEEIENETVSNVVKKLEAVQDEEKEEEEDQDDPEEVDTHSICVLQGKNLDMSLLKIDKEETKEPCEDEVDTLIRDDEDETGNEENENETVSNAKKLEAVQDEEEEEDQDDPEEVDTLSIRVLRGKTLETSLLKIDKEENKQEPCVDVELDDVMGTSQPVLENTTWQAVGNFLPAGDDLEEAEETQVRPVRREKNRKCSRASLRRSPRLGGAMGSIFVASASSGQILRRSARTMKT